MNQNTTQKHQGAPIGTAIHPSTATSTSLKWKGPKAPIAGGGHRAEKQPLPEWVDVRRANHIFTISKSTIYRLSDEGKIRTCSLKERGKLRGKRLFSTDSIVSYLESRASGGEQS
ncbi:MAG: helix-turn-helix domain-containing protein [Verrucomicrobiota bacterium]